LIAENLHTNRHITACEQITFCVNKT
jgi:hypothetical protein